MSWATFPEVSPASSSPATDPRSTGYQSRVTGVEAVAQAFQLFPTYLIGTGRLARNSPLSRALLAGGGVLKAGVQQQAAQRDATRWWQSPYPVFWRYQEYKSEGHLASAIYTSRLQRKRIAAGRYRVLASGMVQMGAKRPVGRLRKAVRVKVSRLSTADMRAVRVYVQFSRQWPKWAAQNAWYARFVEGGTGPQHQKRKGRHGVHVATKAYPFFKPSIEHNQQQALETFYTKLVEQARQYQPPGGR